MQDKRDFTSTIYISRRLLELGQFSFSPAFLANLLEISPRRASILAGQMAADGLAAEVEKGKYLLLGLEPEQVLSNPLFIASQLVVPCYVSYWSALHFHGLTTQVPQTVFCATTRRKRPVDFQGQTFRYVSVRPHKFFGYRRERLADLPILVADEAKTIIDGLDQPRYAGGLPEVAQALHAALDTLDLDLLAEYARRMDDYSLAARLGYLLELFGRPAPDLPASRSPVALDPARPRRGRLNARWRIVINVSPAELNLPGIG